eukprot:2863244-Rhodomonas_salina.3
MLLRACGGDVRYSAYANTHIPPLSYAVLLRTLRSCAMLCCYAYSGTELRYAATRGPRPVEGRVERGAAGVVAGGEEQEEEEGEGG